MPHPLITRAKALIASIEFDNNGGLVAGHYMGGNGGLISRETTTLCDALRRDIEAYEKENPDDPTAI